MRWALSSLCITVLCAPPPPPPVGCRDVSNEISSPMDWMHMPLSFDPEPGAQLRSLQGAAAQLCSMLQLLLLPRCCVFDTTRCHPQHWATAQDPPPPICAWPAGSGSVLRLTAPCVSTPAAQLPAYDRGPGRFMGNHYLKCCSPAWMHEWIMIESLRR